MHALALRACPLRLCTSRAGLAAGTADAYDVKATPKVPEVARPAGLRRHRGTGTATTHRDRRHPGPGRGARPRGITATLKRDRQGRTVRQRRRARPPRRLLRRLPPVLGPHLRRPRGPQDKPAAQDALPGAARARDRAPRHRQAGDHRPHDQGVPILALKVTNNARTTPDGSRPAVLYSANQHAREWITAEVDRRLPTCSSTTTPTRTTARATRATHRGTAAWTAKIATRAVVRARREPGRLPLHVHHRQPPVAQEPARQQRRRPDHAPATASTRTATSPTMGLRQRGLLDDPSSETYRGPARLRARDPGDATACSTASLRVPGQLPLGGSCCSTPGLAGRRPRRPDDAALSTALTGNDDNPAVPASTRALAPSSTRPTARPTDYALRQYGTLAYTPSSTADGPSSDRRRAADCGCGFVFPDDEAACRPSSRRTCRSRSTSRSSATNPANPVSHLGNTAPTSSRRRRFARLLRRPADRRGRRQARPRRRHAAATGSTAAATQTAPTRRVGRRRALRRRDRRLLPPHARRGDRRRARATTSRSGSRSRGKERESFTYRSRATSRNARARDRRREDYTGAARRATRTRTRAELPLLHRRAGRQRHRLRRLRRRRAAAARRRIALGVLGHYEAVIWYTGDDISPASRAAGRHRPSRLAHGRDAGGPRLPQRGRPLLYTGKNARGRAAGPATRTTRPAEPPVLQTGGRRPAAGQRRSPSRDCAVLNDDFLQYWLGAYVHINAANDADGVTA